MSAVIKAAAPDAQVRVSTYRGTPAFVTTPDEATRDPLLERLLEAEARVAGLEAEMAEHQAALDANLAEAHEAGRRDGLAAAADRARERLEALAEGIGDARRQLDTRLVALDTLAAMLARRAIDKVLSGADDQRTLVTAMVRRNLAALTAEMALAVRVSGADFPDRASLDTFSAETCRGVGEVSIDPDLTSGCCRFELALGQLDLSLADQKQQLAAFLDGLADESEPR
jgi:flagellar biosynthesis/type III secretory pathway protein FliH